MKVDIEKIKSWKYPTREKMRQAIYDLIAEVEELREKVKNNEDGDEGDDDEQETIRNYMNNVKEFYKTGKERIKI